MALFSFFKPIKPVGFTYHPRFYDEKKDAFQERLAEAKKSREEADAPGAELRIRSSFRSGKRGSARNAGTYRQQQTKRSNVRLIIILACLILAAYLALEIYLPRLEQWLN